MTRWKFWSDVVFRWQAFLNEMVFLWSESPLSPDDDARLQNTVGLTFSFLFRQPFISSLSKLIGVVEISSSDACPILILFLRSLHQFSSRKPSSNLKWMTVFWGLHSCSNISCLIFFVRMTLTVSLNHCKLLYPIPSTHKGTVKCSGDNMKKQMVSGIYLKRASVFLWLIINTNGDNTTTTRQRQQYMESFTFGPFCRMIFRTEHKEILISFLYRK